MRILRSQYMNYRAQQRPHASTATKTTTTVTKLHNGTEVQHQRSHTYHTRSMTRNQIKSIQTVTQTTQTTVGNNSDRRPLEKNAKAELYRRNSTIIYGDIPRYKSQNAQDAQNAQNAQNIQNTENALSAQTGNSKNTVEVVATPLSIQQRRQTIACIPDELIKQQVLNALKIKLLNTPTNGYTRINLVIKFYDEGTAWYTRFYRSYQNVLWHKLPREGGSKYRRWYFKCEVCQKKLCSFTTLKTHLNIHMKFFPYRCESCPKQYPAKPSFNRHTKAKHGAGNKYVVNKDVKRTQKEAQ